MFFKRKIEREIEETERNLKMSFETTMLPGRIDFFSSTGELIHINCQCSFQMHYGYGILIF